MRITLVINDIIGYHCVLSWSNVYAISPGIQSIILSNTLCYRNEDNPSN